VRNAAFKWDKQKPMLCLDGIYFIRSARPRSSFSPLSSLSLIPSCCKTLARASQVIFCMPLLLRNESTGVLRYTRLVYHLLSISSMLSGSILVVSHIMNFVYGFLAATQGHLLRRNSGVYLLRDDRCCMAVLSFLLATLLRYGIVVDLLLIGEIADTEGLLACKCLQIVSFFV